MPRLHLPPTAEVHDLFDLDELTAPGRAAFDLDVRASAAAFHQNRPQLISEWVQSGVLRLPSRTSTLSGRVKLHGYQPGILDALQEPGLEGVVLKGVPRIGKSTMPALAMAYYAAHEGDDVLFYERSKETAQVFHDTTLWPIIQESPAFERMLREGTRNNDTEDKWMDRLLVNGAFVRLRSAETPGAFKQIRARLACMSEVGDSAWIDGVEGDKIEAAIKRVQSYPDGKFLMESSPTDAETCVITKWYDVSDQRKFLCPCPLCGNFQELKPIVSGEKDKDGPGLRYRLDEADQVIEQFYVCEHCAKAFYEKTKVEIINAGEWHPSRVSEARVGGFFLWAIHSFDEKSSWRRICEEHFKQLRDPTKRQTFKNLWLGLAWERKDTGAVSIESLETRCEPYPAEVPDGVVVITVGGDGQAGTNKEIEAGGKPTRQEIQVVGWGHGEESWILAHIVIDDDQPFSPMTNAKVIEWLNKDWVKRDGTKMRIAAGCLDVNYRMTEGLNFVYGPDISKIATLERGKRLWAVVGRNEAKGSRTKLATLTQTANHQGRRYLRLGTQSGKDTLERRKKLSGSGPEVIHWPSSMIATKGTIYDFFKGMSAISLKKTKDTNRPYWEDKPGNEPIDCWVYAYAALQLLKENYSDVAAALSKPPAQPPQPYTGTDRSHRSEIAAAGITVVDMRATAQAKPKLIDRAPAAVSDPAQPITTRSINVTRRKPSNDMSISYHRL